jgi:mannose-6-phosphate isomerase-like protein (cupin superfamily)
LVDPAINGSKHLTFGMVVVEPDGTCEPGHMHDDQEEIFFCLTGNGVVIADDDHKEIKISPKDAVFIPQGVFHLIKNPYNTPLEALWILSPPGYIFDKFPEMKVKAEKGERV